MKKKLFSGILIILLIIVGMQFFSFKSDREKLRGYLNTAQIDDGLIKDDIPKKMDCKLMRGFGYLNDTLVVLIPGHGNSYEQMDNLGLKIGPSGRSVLLCKNYGFEDEEKEEWKWITYSLFWQKITYPGFMVWSYEKEIIAPFKNAGYENIILIGHSMGSQIAMYLGALNDEVDYVIGVSGLAPYASFINDAPTTIVPGVYEDFTPGEVSCMSKKITWLNGKDDPVFNYTFAENIEMPCSNVELVGFEGKHEVPDNLVIKFLDEYEEINSIRK